MNVSDWEHHVSDDNLGALLQVCDTFLSVCVIYNNAG